MPQGVPWLLWRPVMRQKCTLQELETHWSLADVIVANMLIDCQDAVDWLAMQKARGS